MSEIVEAAIARILFNKIMTHFDDFESFSKIQTSQDFALVCKLDKTLPEKIEGGDVDYHLVVGAWNEFYQSVKELNKTHSDFIDYISKEFCVTFEDDFLISGSLYEHVKFISRKLEQRWEKTYSNYVTALDKILLNFKIKILSYSTAEIQDEFFDHHSMIDSNDIKFSKSDFSGKSIYLDTNALSALAADRKVRDLISESEMGFFYSSYIIEDAVNSNPLFLSSFLSDLKSITKGNMVGYMDEGLSYVHEEIEDTLHRVNKYSKLTKLYESSVMNKAITSFHCYPELRKGKELNEAISRDLIGFFKCEESNKLPGYEKIIAKFQNTSIDEFIRVGDVGQIDDYRDLIEQLSELFDFVNFETEHVKFTNKSKIASSYRDRQHLVHAYICDYFVSDDVRLKKRAQVIFDILGVKTQPISVNELKKKIKAR